MDIEVIRSERRRKTVQARLVDGVLRVSIPARMTPEEEAHWVGVMRQRVDRKQSAADIDLPGRAHRLAAKHSLPLPSDIRWSERQHSLWGSCSVASGRTRVSTRLAAFPRWVLDYVIVHELAHLAEASHSRRFWDLVNRYPFAERARGYLIAKGEDSE